ncbi:AfsR/SARP family transcriptional regulator [Catenulispora rubra]|uniref:AfsR/SARP family transcriptional regulator n=1 Tax=Catenulispora rubra TaxID=280293 RepID=UPI001892097B|nr:BTAD domain-containing putative transcriptional regulator [Catenulispora rubra]
MSGTRFGVLGPLLVEDSSGPRPIAAARQRAVLAALLLTAPRAVAAADLAEQVWNLEPPAGAAGTLHSYLSRLRGALGPLGDRVRTHSSGYTVELRAGELDIDVFRGLRDRARAATARGDLEGATAAYTEALALWRGAPLADVPGGPWRDDAVRYWDEQELLTREELFEVELRLGRTSAVIPQLRVLVGENPFRERPAALLLGALAADGRRAEALAEYQRVRRVLVEEAGIEPGEQLKAAFLEILREGDDRPDAPRLLPADIPDFTGRADQLAAVAEVLTGPEPGDPAPVVVVTGPGGIGKTSFAVRLGQQLRPEFPDGQVFVRLGGLRAPRRPTELVSEVLRALGVTEFPGDADKRTALLRSTLADRRVLLVLDDATDSAQIRRLLPASAPAAVIVTSRRRLPGLAGQVPVELGRLPTDQAVAMLGRIIGADRAEAEPSALRLLAEACGGLPIALRICGARLAQRRGRSVASLVARLEAVGQRLAGIDALDDGTGTSTSSITSTGSSSSTSTGSSTGTSSSTSSGTGTGTNPGTELPAAEAQRTAAAATAERTALRGPLEESYLALSYGAAGRDVDLARAFRLLSLIGGERFSLPAAAAVLGVDEFDADSAVEHLVQVSLLEPSAPERFAFHPLIQELARGHAAASDPGEARSEAVGRWTSWCLAGAAAADRLFDPNRPRLAWEAWIPEADPAPFAGLPEAGDWFDRESAGLLEAAAVAVAQGDHATAAALPLVLLQGFRIRGRVEELEEPLRAGVEAAIKLGEPEVAGVQLNSLAIVYGALGRFDEAIATFGEAVPHYESAGLVERVAQARINAAITVAQSGRPGEAAERLKDALAELDALPATPFLSSLQVSVMLALTEALRDSGNPEEALDLYPRLLAAAEAVGDTPRLAIAWGNLGKLHAKNGRAEEGIPCIDKALELHRSIGNRDGEGYALWALGEACALLGQRDRARGAWSEAREIFLALGRQGYVADLAELIARADVA